MEESVIAIQALKDLIAVSNLAIQSVCTVSAIQQALEPVFASADLWASYAILLLARAVFMDAASMEPAVVSPIGKETLVMCDNVQRHAAGMDRVHRVFVHAALVILETIVVPTLAQEIALEMANVMSLLMNADASEDSMVPIAQSLSAQDTALDTVSVTAPLVFVSVPITGTVMIVRDTLVQMTALIMESVMKHPDFASATIGGRVLIAPLKFASITASETDIATMELVLALADGREPIAQSKSAPMHALAMESVFEELACVMLCTVVMIAR